GLGTCWIGRFKEPEVRNILEVPEGLRVIALTPLGYLSTSFVAKDRGRKSPGEIVHYEKF
ncbi:nitroreductase family protein, partial [Candidatus Hakubella thermalkaliphila]